MAWVLFRLESWEGAKIYYTQLFDWKDMKYIDLNNSFLFILILAFLFSIIGRFQSIEKRTLFLTSENIILSVSKATLIAAISIVLLFLSVVFLSASNLNPFIYYRF
jgi:hypothetical protein